MRIGGRNSSSRSPPRSSSRSSSSLRNLLLDTISKVGGGSSSSRKVCDDDDDDDHCKKKNKTKKNNKKNAYDDDDSSEKPEDDDIPLVVELKEPQDEEVRGHTRRQRPQQQKPRKSDLSSGTIVRAILVKETQETPVGLTLWDVYGDGQPPRIYDITPQSAASQCTKLEPGFVVEAISYSNVESGLVDLHFGDEYYTQSCFTKNGQFTKQVVTLSQVQTILAEAPAGSITVRARVA